MKGVSLIGQTLNELIKNEDLFIDVKEEVTIILETLKPLDKPNPVRAEGDFFVNKKYFKKIMAKNFFIL